MHTQRYRADKNRIAGWGWSALVMWLLIVAWALLAAGPTDVEAQRAADELTIAAASDLQFAMKELVAQFELTHQTTVRLSLGSSGNFFAQIQNGAPFDLYFSADIGYPKKLEEEGMASPCTLFRYAIGRLVLWAPKGSAVRLDHGLEALRDPQVKKVAIANPKHAPYGRAAVSAMQSQQLYDTVKDKLVLAENISQAAQYVESGAADVGIIALSLALAPSMKTAGQYWEIPAEMHAPLEQGAVILKRSARQGTASQFIEFVKSREGQEILQRYGFTRPH